VGKLAALDERIDGRGRYAELFRDLSHGQEPVQTFRDDAETGAEGTRSLDHHWTKRRAKRC
jgi:hypothetical protein